MLQYVAVCRSMLQYVAVCCSALRRVSCVSVCEASHVSDTVRCSMMQYDAVCCSVLQCVAVCCSVVNRVSCVSVCNGSNFTHINFPNGKNRNISLRIRYEPSHTLH